MKEVSFKNQIESKQAKSRYSALILAAGNSGRMGTDKALLVARGSTTFSEFLVDRFLASGAEQVILVLNQRLVQSGSLPGRAEIIINRELDKGRSHSILLGLEKVPKGYACFIQNVDNPYTDAGLIRRMLSVLQPNSYVVPVNADKGGHPVLLSPHIIEHMLTGSEWSDFRKVLSAFPKIQLPWEDDRIHCNINTPEDYCRWLSMK